MKTEYTDNNGNTFELDSLLSCPFCGGDPVPKFIGNNYTKMRIVEIKCSKCFTEQKTATIYHDHQWCMKVATEKWNLRIYLKL